MLSSILRGLALAAAGVVLTIAFAQVSISADPPGGTNDDSKADAKSIREQEIYIPYDKLRQVFEKQGRGVFLPYEKFQELWKAAQDKTQTPAPAKPPVGAVITEIENEATAEKDVVRVKARVKIELLAEGWQEIPLRLADSAITSAKLGDQPARIVGAAGQDYRLLVEKKGKQPESIELSLEYAKAITRSPGQNSVVFQAPQAPVSRWKVKIPQSGVKVDIQPLLAATEVPAENKNPPSGEKAADETVVLAFVGAAPTVRIGWTPKAEGATGLTALAGVQVQQQLVINESVIRSTATLDYSISRAELAKLSIEAPGDYKVVNVFDDNVRQWSVEPSEGKQTITVQLFEPAKKTQRIVVELEKYTREKLQDSIQVPVVKALEASRQQGVVVVRVADGLRGEITKSSGLQQIDARELPPALAGQAWAFSYRYAVVPYDLSLAVEKIMPRISADSLVEAFLEPEKLSVDLLTVYNIERAGVFRLELDLPPGFDVRNVRGASVPQIVVPSATPGAAGTPVPGAVPVQVDNHHLEGENKRRLVVNLSAKAIGRVALAVNMVKDLQLPELLTPTGKSADIELPVPQPAPGALERATGRLVVYSPESLRVNPGKNVGLGTVSIPEAMAGYRPPRTDKFGGMRPVLAFSFAQEPGTLALAAERRKPYVTVKQLLVARIEKDVAKYEANFFYNVQYSSVKSLRIDLPEDVAKNAHTQTAHDTISPPPGDLSKGYVAWRFRGESELFGEGKIKLVWEEKIDKLDIGKSVNLNVPYLKPADVDRAWGQIVLIKSETINIHELGEPKALQPIDPQQDLMEKVEGAARAFAFHDDWELTVVATHYQLEEVKRTSIERGLARMVVTPANEISVQVLYRISTARDRLAVKLPDNVKFDTEPLKINGRSVMLERQKSDYYIPVVEPNAGTPFILEMRYSLPGDGSRLDLPDFPQDPAVQKVYLAVYLPETKSLLGTTGPWNSEYRWRMGPWVTWHAQHQVDKNVLLEWIYENAGQSARSPDNFQTDGSMYLYSTLRPESSPQGSLHMTIADRRVLNALVFLGVFLCGAALAFARFCYKALAVGTVVAVLILLGVFSPTFTMQILNGILILAFSLVLILWVVICVFRCRKFCFCKSNAAGKAITDAASGGKSAGDVPQSGSNRAEVPQSEPQSPAVPPKSEGNDKPEGGTSNARN